MTPTVIADTGYDHGLLKCSWVFEGAAHTKLYSLSMLLTSGQVDIYTRHLPVCSYASGSQLILSATTNNFIARRYKKATIISVVWVEYILLAGMVLIIVLVGDLICWKTCSLWETVTSVRSKTADWYVAGLGAISSFPGIDLESECDSLSFLGLSMPKLELELDRNTEAIL